MQRVGFSNIIQLIMMTSGSFKTHNIFVTCTNLWTCILLENMCTGLRPGCTQLTERCKFVTVICRWNLQFLFTRNVRGKVSILNDREQCCLFLIKEKKTSHYLLSLKEQHRNFISAKLSKIKFLALLVEAKAHCFLNEVFTLEMSRNYSFRDKFKRWSHKCFTRTHPLTLTLHQCLHFERQVIYSIAKKSALGNIRRDCHSASSLVWKDYLHAY